ncbi:MAG TPA: hypothetical protein VMD91_02990 [Candidatus Sulfotelmatobacter sp.]|nr:hypothetical protein [Candidatus Sulfotelmatobacter sp.]
MRHTRNLALLALVVLAALAAFSQADAVQATKTSKIVEFEFVITPSPAPSVGALPAPQVKAAAAIAAAPRTDASTRTLLVDPFAGPRQVAWGGPSWDVAPGIQIAQVQAQPSPVPVQFVTKADPNAQYLQVTPGSAGTILTAVYGTNYYACALTIKTYYTTAYGLTDWGYGTSTSSAIGYPIENYPTTSYLAWAAEASPEPVPEPTPATFTGFYNEGSPGQTVWSKAANVTYTGCIDLRLTVPTAVAPGTYSAVIEYNLQVTI